MRLYADVDEHPNVERTRRGFQAFVDRDMATIADLLREDIVWRVPGRSILAGEHGGRDAVLAFLGRAVALTGGTYSTELRWAVGDDERVVAAYRATGERDGRILDLEQLLVCRVEDGRWVEVDALPTDLYAFDEFWA